MNRVSSIQLFHLLIKLKKSWAESNAHENSVVHVCSNEVSTDCTNDIEFIEIYQELMLILRRNLNQNATQESVIIWKMFPIFLSVHLLVDTFTSLRIYQAHEMENIIFHHLRLYEYFRFPIHISRPVRVPLSIQSVIFVVVPLLFAFRLA